MKNKLYTTENEHKALKNFADTIGVELELAALYGLDVVEKYKSLYPDKAINRGTMKDFLEWLIHGYEND